MIGLTDVQDAAERIAGRVLRTPTLYSDAISRATGAEVTLKLENLQAIGSFKERGAANRLALLTTAERRAGVIAMSAGNHAQAVARHASLAGIAATIVMPKHTPATKVSRTAAWGATVVLHGDTVAEAGERAHALAAEQGLVFVHPYDDPAVMAGQGTLALELLQDAPDIDVLLVPVGGGGIDRRGAAGGRGRAAAGDRDRRRPGRGLCLAGAGSGRAGGDRRRRHDRRGHRRARHRPRAAGGDPRPGLGRDRGAGAGGGGRDRPAGRGRETGGRGCGRDRRGGAAGASGPVRRPPGRDRGQRRQYRPAHPG